MRLGLVLAGMIAVFGWSSPVNSAAPATEPSACTLRSNFDFLRDLVFTSAATTVPDKSASLNRLKRAVVAQGADVRAVGYEPATGRIECAMTLRLGLPASSRAFFGGADELSAPVQFWAEPSDSGGFSVVTRGLGSLSAKVVEAARRFPEAPDFGAVVPDQAAPPLSALPKSLPAKALLRPGFDCAKAASRTELMICSSEALAETDRLLAERYFAVRSTLVPSERHRLLIGQRTFLASRDRCEDQACLVGLYIARKAQLDRGLAPVRRRAN